MSGGSPSLGPPRSHDAVLWHICVQYLLRLGGNFFLVRRPISAELWGYLTPLDPRATGTLVSLMYKQEVCRVRFSFTEPSLLKKAEMEKRGAVCLIFFFFV